MTNSIVDVVYDALQKQITDLKADVVSLQSTSEQAQYTDGIPAYTVANLPTVGLADGSTYVTLAFASNGRKAAEGAGLGTGQLCYFNAATSQWLRVRDDSVITA